MTELMIHTGGGPTKICQLRLDCLVRDAHGKPVLIYTDSDNDRLGRRLPIAEATARIITGQQADVPGPLPRPAPRSPTCRCSRGTHPIAGHPHLQRGFHQRAPQAGRAPIAALLVTTVTGEDGTEHEELFDRRAVVPYAYRHSYAQRHADEGASPDVLR